MAEQAGGITEQELLALKRESEDLQRQVDRLLGRFHRWSMTLGPLQLGATFGSQRLFRLFIGFHIGTGLSGAALILGGGRRASDLGIALVVGALFGLGAFLAQFWAQAIEKDHWVSEIHDRPFRDHLRELLERCGQLDARLEAMADTDASQSSPSRLPT